MLKTISEMKKLEISSYVDDVIFEDSSDSDECEGEEIDQLFSNCELVKEKSASDNEYILHVTSTSESDASIVTCLSDNSSVLYKLSNSEIAHIKDLSEHNEKIIGCRFSSVDNNLLYTGSLDGTLKVWDVRTSSKSSATFTDITTTDGKRKKFNCFDVSTNDRLITAGTDIFDGDAFILFWDIRNTKLLGGYWEAHTDDITDVKFHPDNMNTLISGSTDSLINVYDLSQSTEDDALLDSLNTESSVEQLLWFKENSKNCISCITHVADLQLWQLDGVSPYQHIQRAELAKAIKRKNDGYIYIASHQAKTSLLVLVGSNYEDGQCIRGLEIKKGQVSPSIGFRENTQRVRCSWYSENTNILLTGGEKGLLNVWKVKKNI